MLKCLDYAGSPVADPSRGGGASVLGAARTSAVLVVLGLGMAPATAQELTPRAYAPSPTGGNIVLLAYGRSAGEVLFDPVLPFDDVSSTINSGSLLYGRTFGLLGRSANAAVVLPYIWGELDGFVEGEHRQVTRSGLGDLRAQLTVNVLGGPALAPREFASHRPDTVLGFSIAVSAPSGQYDASKLINLGANRWSFKPQLGFSKTLGRWYLELYGGVWIFRTNTDFFGGSVREQDPLGTRQAHASFTFRPRLWLKVAWASGFTTRNGADFDSLGVAWQTVWFGNPR